MTITICGSMKFYKQMRKVKKALVKLGHRVRMPVGIEKEVPVEIKCGKKLTSIVAAKIEYDVIKKHFRNIEKSDAILVLNFDKNGVKNYIGGNTFLEIGVAFWLGKKIFLWSAVPRMDYQAELHSTQPIVLYGHLDKM